MRRARDISMGQSGTTIIVPGSTNDNLFSNLPLRGTPVYMREYFDLLSIDQPCSTDADCRGVLRERLGPGSFRFISAQCADNMSCHWTYYPNGREQSTAVETTRPQQKLQETLPSASMVAYAAGSGTARPTQDQRHNTTTRTQTGIQNTSTQDPFPQMKLFDYTPISSGTVAQKFISRYL